MEENVELIDFDKYIIYEDGNVFSKSRNCFLSNTPHNGYIRNSYRLKNGKENSLRRNRVIYFYFKKENIRGLEIDHIDGNKTNNSIDNLRLTDRKGNMNNPITIERMKKRKLSEENKNKLNKAFKEKYPHGVMYGKHHTEETKQKISEKRKGQHSSPQTEFPKKKISQYDLNDNFIRNYDSANEAGRIIGKSQSGITKCCRGKGKTAYGFKWKYVDDI